MESGFGQHIRQGKLTSPVAVKAVIAECNRIGRMVFLAEYGSGNHSSPLMHAPRR
ncbi:MAG: hypothetical protein V7608_5811 [Hyphomicrobiales bacterium]|jgi:hypothetical protein